LPKVSQKDDLNNLKINPIEWSLIEALHGLLQPFYYATMHLQQQSFPSLSSAKIISNSLIFDFKNRTSNDNRNRNERILSQLLIENLEKHLA
jgi:hypothetical protein